MCATIARSRQALLAIAFLAVRGAAFVPGGIMPPPHVHVPPTMSSMPGRSAGAPVIRLRTEVRSSTLDGQSVQAAGPAAPEAPEAASLKASDILKQWSNDAAKDSYFSNYKNVRLLRGKKAALRKMSRTVAEGIPGYVFALSSDKEDEDIQAIATVIVRASADGQEDVVEIREMVAKSTVDGKKYITALLRSIGAWAEGRSVTISPDSQLEDYYTRLGVALEDVASRSAAFGGRPRPEKSPSGGVFAMREVRPDQAQKAISTWMADAADFEPPHVARSTEGVLGVMSRTIAAGSPKHVFALATGEGAEAIQAIATISVGVRAGAGPDEPDEVVDIRELVTRPAADGDRHVAELVRGIYSWAGGRFVTLSLSEELVAYHRSHGYAPMDVAWLDRVLGESWFEEARGGAKWNMCELELDVQAAGDTAISETASRWAFPAGFRMKRRIADLVETMRPAPAPPTTWTYLAGRGPAGEPPREKRPHVSTRWAESLSRAPATRWEPPVGYEPASTRAPAVVAAPAVVTAPAGLADTPTPAPAPERAPPAGPGPAAGPARDAAGMSGRWVDTLNPAPAGKWTPPVGYDPAMRPQTRGESKADRRRWSETFSDAWSYIPKKCVAFIAPRTPRPKAAAQDVERSSAYV
mmetsp:Transcript_20711/g.58090  ORF Transcript_20711/g.58090 Transcript_20711/m.58090 type:complete len:639 (-) Transcript_20711:105-2021(-)